MSKSLEAVLFPDRFEPFLKVSNKNDFDNQWRTNLPWVLSNMAHAAYHGEDKVKKLMATFGARKTCFYDTQGAQAFLGIWSDRAILSFRGTQPVEGAREDRGSNPFAGINILLGTELDPNLLGFLSNDVLADLLFTKTVFDGFENVEVHSGFLREIDKLWEAVILPDLEKHIMGLPVWVTGHSLGGAMATLAGMRYPFEGVVTFGEPRVGQNIHKAFKAKTHTRYVNGDDPVTKVPPELPFRYDHHGNAVRISDSDGETNLLFDHAIVYYSENLA